MKKTLWNKLCFPTFLQRFTPRINLSSIRSVNTISIFAHINTRPATVLIQMINTQPRSTTNALYSHYINPTPSCVHASVADYWFFGGRNVTIAISDITEFPRKFLIRIPWVPHLSTTSSHHMILLFCQVLTLSVCALRLTSNGALLISQVCAGINLKFVYEGTRFILLMGVWLLCFHSVLMFIFTHYQKRPYVMLSHIADHSGT